MIRTLILALLISTVILPAKADESKFLKKPNQSSDDQIKGLTAACQIGKTVTEISLNNVRTYIHMDGVPGRTTIV